jgi:hypothetical protein
MIFIKKDFENRIEPNSAKTNQYSVFKQEGVNNVQIKEGEEWDICHF